MTRRQSLALLLGAIATPWRKAFAKPGPKPTFSTWTFTPKVKGLRVAAIREVAVDPVYVFKTEQEAIAYMNNHLQPLGHLWSKRFLESDRCRELLEFLETKSPNPKV